jgi:VanZ family protein
MPYWRSVPWGDRRTTLFCIAVALVVHGSLYPWRFAWPDDWPGVVRHFFDSPLWTGADDVLGNVALFVPLGWLGGAWAGRSARRRGVVAMALAAFAVALQWLQMLVPSRDAVLSDAVWNVIGTAAGQALAAWRARVSPPSSVGAADRAARRWLALCWLVAACWPLWSGDALASLAALSSGHMRGLAWQWKPTSFAEAALGVVALAYLLRTAGQRWGAVYAMVGIAAVVSLLLAPEGLQASRAAGMACGLAAAHGLVTCDPRRVAFVVAVAAAGWFIADELRPLVFSATPGRFHLMPFAAMLRGSMLANTLGLMLAMFWLSAAAAALLDLGMRPWKCALGLSLLALSLEVAQRWLPGRTADITPALLPWLSVLLLSPGLARAPGFSPCPRAAAAG